MRWPWSKAPAANPQQTHSKPTKKPVGFLSTHADWRIPNFGEWLSANAFQRGAPVPVSPAGVAMDDTGGNMASIKSAFTTGQAGIIPQNLFAWYVSQGFIGFQACAIIAQHWLVNKACSVAPRDAVRKGYEITSNNGEDLPVAILDRIRQLDCDYKINKQLVEFARFNRVFGIRIALFVVESNDKEYYQKPFNPDGIRPNSYKGISQIDPYWITPELDADAAANTASPFFYEPTYWRINGIRYHRSHLVLIRHGEVADVLKPSYIYAGVPMPQQIFERVYAAERTANEAPLLAMTKRTTVMNVDMDAVIADQAAFEERLALWIYYKDNQAVKVAGLDETVSQIDTSLADLDAVIMTQYQIVAAIANTPATKLLGTSVKGFNATGEFDESVYHEYLETIQTDELTPLLERHHLLCLRSDPELIAHAIEFGEITVAVNWLPLDSMTETEQADVHLKDAQAMQALQATGAIDGLDIRRRLTLDKSSGFNGLEMPDDDAGAMLETDPDTGLPLDNGLPPEATPADVEVPQGEGATVDEPDMVANEIMTNMTAQQFLHLERILRKVGKGTISEQQGLMLMQGAFGLTEAQAQKFMGIQVDLTVPDTEEDSI